MCTLLSWNFATCCSTLETKARHFDNFAATNGTEVAVMTIYGITNDEKNCQIEDLLFSVYFSTEHRM